MSYEELRSHAEEIKRLAIEKTVEEIEDALDGDPDQDTAVAIVRRQAEETFAGVEAIFDDWTDLPDPWLLGGGTGNIAAALPFLASSSYLDDATANEWAGAAGTSHNISQIEPTGAFMQGWTSGTSLSYANFASLFGPVTSNLSMAAHVLKGACEAEEALWTEARKSIDELAHATIDALGSVNDKDPKGVSTALTVIGAVAGIVAVPFTAGGSLVAAYSFAAIAGGLSIGGAFVPEAEETASSISGSSPREIVESLRAEMTKLNNDIIAKEDDIARALSDSADDFEAAYALEPGQSPVKMPRPSVADNPTFGGRE
ncbi:MULTISPECIES: hypothetical protein [unclassified Nocardioides]|uniref:hypothetical protein n=1 Tax=unclassified Nocardioides TaxID=2615069 RepID=UPI0026658825|nr:hypothetical protein [Nocardioides sp. Arc9.136]WKN49499.1 hypothetical protein OSR43_05050 [Nocardioides sp. Arc9.136]